MQFIILSIFLHKTFYNLLAFAYYFVERLSERFELCTTGRNHVTSVLHDLGAALPSSDVEVIECTRILGSNSPLSQFAPPFNKTPQVETHKISGYDDGPVCAWNWLKLGGNSGTHFDALNHWFTGNDLTDNATDTMDVQKVVAPVNATISVCNLHHIGASTHPGPGLGGVSDFNIAKALGA